MQDLLPPVGGRQELQGHSVALYTDLDGSLRTFELPLLGEAPLVLLQQTHALPIEALKRTNHSSARDLTSCAVDNILRETSLI